MKFPKILLFAGLLSLTCACSEETLSEQSVVTTETDVDNSEFGQWLQKNYTEPYNIRFNYRYVDKLAHSVYNVVPADEEKSKALAILIKKVWMDAYEEVAGKDFLKQKCFREFHLIGSPQVKENGSITLGTAEGGIMVTLYRVNELDPKKVYINQDNHYEPKERTPLDLNFWYFHTMHHEFMHILNQTKNYSTDFQTISAGKYHNQDWVNVKDEDSPKEGFVTGYASMEPREDIAEIYSTYVTLTEKAWQDVLNHGVVVKRDEANQPVYQRDKDGNFVYAKDEKGNKIYATDEKTGDLIPARDAKGNIIYEKNPDGSYKYFETEGGKKIPVYKDQGKVVYGYMNGKVVAAYFDKSGEPKLITEPTEGDLEYEKNEAGKPVYDEHGKPVYAYYKIPVFEYEKLPVVDASGKEAILKKLNIIRSYLKDSWGLDLDKIREAVLRKSKEAETMDLTKLP